MENIFLALQLTAVGMSVVFVGLTLLVVLLTLFQRLDHWLTQSKATKQAQSDQARADQARAAAPVAGMHSEGVAPEVIVALSAAVAIGLSKKVRIHRIRYLGGQPETAWSRQGRISIMASHVTK